MAVRLQLAALGLDPCRTSGGVRLQIVRYVNVRGDAPDVPHAVLGPVLAGARLSADVQVGPIGERLRRAHRLLEFRVEAVAAPSPKRSHIDRLIRVKPREQGPE
jgi:hypothetical protein